MSGHRILTGRTRLTGPGGRAYVLNAGDVLPEWAVGRVGEHLLQPEDPAPAQQPAAPAAVSPAGQEDASVAEPETDGRGKASLTPPPKGGAGSGTTAWAEYARANGVNVGDDDDRGDIIAALDAAGVLTDAD